MVGCCVIPWWLGNISIFNQSNACCLNWVTPIKSQQLKNRIFVLLTVFPWRRGRQEARGLMCGWSSMSTEVLSTYVLVVETHRSPSDTKGQCCWTWSLYEDVQHAITGVLEKSFSYSFLFIQRSIDFDYYKAPHMNCTWYSTCANQSFVQRTTIYFVNQIDSRGSISQIASLDEMVDFPYRRLLVCNIKKAIVCK